MELSTVGLFGVAIRGLHAAATRLVSSQGVRARVVDARGDRARDLAAWRHAVARRRGRAAGEHSCALGYVPPLRYIVSPILYLLIMLAKTTIILISISFWILFMCIHCSVIIMLPK